MKGLRLLNGHDAEVTYAADLEEFCAALARGDSSRVQRLLSRNPKLGHVDKWRIQRRIDVMSMKPRKLSAVLS